MCGIAGAVAVDGLPPDALSAALAAQQHRGPDGEGVWSDGRCTLGQRRLAIIDLSEAGQAPIANEDGSVWVTHNGEIYNFLALRRELEALGHRFRSATDTEVIVHAYEEWGTDCVSRFRGMWAFGLWDSRRSRLFLSRDPVGKKPLFYTEQSGRFLFASELQALLASPEGPREVDLDAIDAYLSWGYIPPPWTGFRGIKKLPPAYTLTLDVGPRGHNAQLRRFWSLSYLPKLDISEQEAAEGLRERLREAVRLRLISDVPLGAFLSGGVDSSIVVALMAQLSPQPVKTFSIGFDDADFDELGHARRVAERWRTDHHEHVVRPEATEILPTLVRHYGEPYADSSAVPTFYVAQITRPSVTVALSGDGGDESFAGYDRYRANALAGTAALIPGNRLLIGGLARAVPDPADERTSLGRLHRFLDGALQPQPARYERWQSIFTATEKAALYSNDFRNRDHALARWFAGLFGEAEGLDPVEAAMSVDVRSYLPFDLLVKVDIASMAHSLEVRSPFLDVEVMEFAARLPRTMKLRGRHAKHLLKTAFSDLVPASNMNRRKMGFGVPVGRWFRGPLRDVLRESLLSERSLERGYFDPVVLRRVVDQHLAGGADHGAQLWALMMLEMWHREVVEAPRSSVVQPSP
ncbi:MAG: asparagine synthase (glutamine-hydrolyzing) [Actinomycetota bacterium]|nr:asparagine synthase (glutamine-hydrolyzing) [Actinomycetota bacterium]